MTIRVKGTQNSSSSGYEVIIDAFSRFDNGAVTTAPAASFTSFTTDLTANFTDTSTDSDGTISSRSWNFGDGGLSTAVNPIYTYTAAGTYTVTLTVTDNDGGSGSASQSVTVTEPSLIPAAPTNLTASIQSTGKGKNKVVESVLLNWSDNSNDPNNEDVFVIERCQEAGKGRNKICGFAGIGTTVQNIPTFLDKDLPDSGSFKYRVRETNRYGNSAYTNVVKI